MSTKTKEDNAEERKSSCRLLSIGNLVSSITSASSTVFIFIVIPLSDPHSVNTQINCSENYLQQQLLHCFPRASNLHMQRNLILHNLFWPTNFYLSLLKILKPPSLRIDPPITVPSTPPPLNLSTSTNQITNPLHLYSKSTPLSTLSRSAESTTHRTLTQGTHAEFILP